MRHRAVDDFWTAYSRLPKPAQRLADKNFELLRADLRHAGLRFKEVREGLWSARIGFHYRALAYPEADGLTWFAEFRAGLWDHQIGEDAKANLLAKFAE